MYMAFLDIWAAYDTVSRDIVWDKCRARGVPERLIRMLSGMADQNASAIIGDGQRSDWFYASAGLAQGAPLSPILYNVFIDDLCHQLEAKAIGIRTATGNIVPGALFADDVGLAAASTKDLQSLVDVCVRHSRANLYRWKPSKSVVVTGDASKVRIYGIVLQREPYFTYLGVPLTTRGIDGPRMVERLQQKCMDALRIMASIGVNAYGYQPYRACLAYKSFIRSTLEYGVAAAALAPAQIKVLELAQNRALRKVLGGYQGSSIEVMRHLAEVEPMYVRVQELQVRRIIRVIDAGNQQNALMSKVLSDCLQDGESTIRRIIQGSSLWNQTWDGRAAGASLRALWNDAEIAAVTFRIRNRGPWPSNADGSFPDCSDIDTRGIAEAFKINQRDERWANDLAEGRGFHARDLPPEVRQERKSPLRYIKCDRVDRRLILNWWLNGLPSHRTGIVCQICQQVIPSERGARLHVATCALAHGVPGLQVRNLGIHAALAVDGVAQDPITQQIWVCSLNKQWQTACPHFDTLVRALRVISEVCLGRIRGGANDRLRQEPARGI